MAQPKKGTLFNVLVPMVDRTDFASIESDLSTESDFNSKVTKKVFQYNQQVSTLAASATISKAMSLIRSGVWQVTLNPTETNFDRVLIWISHPSCALQLIPVDFQDFDDSDIMSRLSDTRSMVLVIQSFASDILSGVVALSDAVSNVMSAVLLTQSLASDAASAAAQANSRVLLVQSITSDIDSALTSRFSNLESFLTVTDSALQSDILSQVRANASQLLLVKSLLSDVDSALTSQYSNMKSMVSTTGVQLNASSLSDLRSAIAAVTATVGASDISDIASAVADVLASRLSDILSAAVQTNSRVILVLSLASDIDSALTSRFSDLHSFMSTTGVGLHASAMSDLRSAIAAGPAATVTASDISDIASAVRVLVASDLSDILSQTRANASQLLLVKSMASDAASAAQQANSRALVIQSGISDLDSAIASQFGDSPSASDLASIVMSALSDTLSNIYSAAVQGASRALLIQSNASDIESALNSQYSNLLSLFTTTGVQVNASSLSDIRSAILIVQSMASDAASAAAQANSRALVIQSFASDIDSALTSRFSDLHSFLSTTGIALNPSTISDIRSAIAAGPAATITDSDISNVASAVADILASRLSDILSAAVQTNSRALVLQSAVSDLDSALTSRFSDIHSFMSTTGVGLNASMMSDLRSAIATVGVTLSASDISDIASAVAAAVTTVSASDISDIASAVNTILASRLSDILSAAVANTSQLLLMKSLLSDIDSAVSSQYSDVASKVGVGNSKLLLLQSTLSDVDSALTSQYSDVASKLAGVGTSTSSISDIISAMEVQIGSRLSDILSAAQQANSRLLVNQSVASDILSAVTAIKANTDNLPSAVKKNTALSNFEFPMIDTSTHAPSTGLVVAVSRSIDGAAFAASTNTPATEVGSGVYKINMSAADLNGNVITFRFSAAGADDRFVTIVTKP